MPGSNHRGRGDTDLMKCVENGSDLNFNGDHESMHGSSSDVYISASTRTKA